MTIYIVGAILCIVFACWGLWQCATAEQEALEEPFDDIEFFDFWIDDE